MQGIRYSPYKRSAFMTAVDKGNIQKVREIINSRGLSYSQEWSDALDGYHLLLTALENKHTEVAKLLLTNGSKVNYRNRSSNTPLHFAVLNGDIEIVQMFLNRGADINAGNFNGKLVLHNADEKMNVKINCITDRSNVTPLHLAIKNDSKEITNLLLSRGANVNAKGNDGTTCLHIATERGDFQIVEQLLKRGADVNTAYTSTIREGYTSLHLAAERGSKEITRLLLSKGADVNVKGRHDTTALHIATEKGHSQIVLLLLKHGADVNSVCTSAIWEGYTPLLLAAETGHEEIAKLLLRYGADINAKEIRGTNSLHIATERGHLHIVAHLLKHGVDVHSPSRKGRTPLYLAVEKGHEKVVKLLLQRGANVHAEDKGDKTLLLLAVEKGRSIIVEHILQHCPDLNSKSNSSVLNVAVQKWEKEGHQIVKNLLQYGFTVDSKDAKKFMHAAVQHRYLDLLEELLKHSTDVNMLCNSAYRKGHIPLHAATKRGSEEVAKLLISYGASVNTQDETGKTPIFYATEKADLNMTKLLLNNKANVKDDPELLNDAVREGRREIVEVLLQHGADANAGDKYGRMPLHFIILDEAKKTFERSYRKNLDINVKGEIAKLLLSWGANPNTRVHNCMPMLYAAIEKGYVKVVEALLEYNADVNCMYEDKITPLHLSTLLGNGRIVQMLLNKGANINAECTNGDTALYFAIKGNFIKIVELLLKRGAKVDGMIEDDLRPPLYMAAQFGNLKIVELLLKFGASVDIVMDPVFMSLFEIAAEHETLEVVECLLKSVGRVDSAITRDITTPLHRAADLDFPNVVELLLKLGANVDSTDEFSYTALHNAARSGYADIVRALLEHGADITITSSDNYTALGFAMDGIRGSHDNDVDYYTHDGDEISNYVGIAEILKRHIIKVKAANLHVVNKHVLTISSDDEEHFLNESDKEIERVYSKKVREERRLARYDFQDECEKEVASMKREKFVNTNITFYDILTKDVNRLAMYARSESIVEALGSGDYKEMFPIYASMINNNFMKGEKRKEFLEQGIKIFYLLFNNFPELSRDCAERIFSYLNDEDISTLMNDCKPTVFFG